MTKNKSNFEKKVIAVVSASIVVVAIYSIALAGVTIWLVNNQ